jgi:glycosyltransferase involved in cell wall biosynthesis
MRADTRILQTCRDFSTVFSKSNQDESTGIRGAIGDSLRILQVTPSFYPAAQYGGPIYSGYSLCNHLAKIPALDLRILTTDSDGPDRIDVLRAHAIREAGYQVHYCHRWLASDFAPGMFARLVPMIKWANVIHLTAVYSPPTIPTLLLSKLLRKPVVWSVRGALQRWQGTTRATPKQIWERLCDSLCEKDRVVLHVTSEEEGRASSQRIKNARPVVIPNGVEVPPANGERQWRPTNQLRLLYLGRLHPIKGIENLLVALVQLDTKVSLSICGNGSKQYEQLLKSLVVELSLTDRVRFCGAVAGEEKEKQFREADVCVVPSFSENFGMVVAEALATGVPVIASTGAPWSEIERHGCGFSVENDPQSLVEAINRISSVPLAAMGKKGRVWMEREFTWPSVAQRMNEVYRGLASKFP